MSFASYVNKGVVAVFLVVLVGCGGGSSGKKSSERTTSVKSSSSQSSSSSVPKLTQVLKFETESEVTVLIGDATNIKATGEGTGTIRYLSNNENIVTVDGTGRIIAKNQPGTATITASISADETYAEATAIFTVKVLPKIIPVSIWIGEKDAVVDFPLSAIGFEFYRTTQSDCNIDSISSCDNGQMEVINQTPMTDAAITASQSGFYTLKNGNYKGTLQISHLSGENAGNTPVPADPRYDVVVHDGKLWLSGSIFEWDANSGIWTSNDGLIWARESLGGSLRFMTRFEHDIYSFNDQLWMIGGDRDHDSNKYKSINYLGLIDPLHPNAFTWLPAEQENDFAWRIGHQIVSFNSKLFVIAGSEKSGAVNNNIWSSTDGVVWTEASASAAFSARMYHQVVSFNNKLWLIGGRDADYKYKNDVWSSVDGITWVQETTAAQFPARWEHQVVVFNNKLWLIGGDSAERDKDGNVVETLYNDVWSSTDGVTWILEQESAAFSPRRSHKVVNFNNGLLLVGGNDGEDQKDIWKSVDGINWRKGFSGQFEITNQSATPE